MRYLQGKLLMIKLILASYLYEQVNLKRPQTRISNFYKKILQYPYRLILKYSDPVVRVRVRHIYLYMNASHDLPGLTASFPYYDTALPRICTFLKKKRGHLTLIDVGANIGDTVSLITDKVTGSFLCIEGDKKYLDLLRMNVKNNVKDIENVVIENVFVSDVDEELSVSFTYDHGTSYVAQQLTKNKDYSITTTTIDKLVEKHQTFSKADIIKIDTDGYDYKVIRGSSKLINESRPVIYFELSPEHLRIVGDEDPVSIFNYVLQMGYSKALFYDWTGLPLIKINTSETETISTLLSYASIKAGFYYDVLLFHDSQEENFHEFYQEEIKIFPVKKWF
jgi:FkbM family methyltransferase